MSNLSNKNFTLKNQTIVITGASSGIGKACAQKASDFGANVILIARDENRLNRVKNSLSKGNHLIYSVDVTDAERLEQVIDNAVSLIGKISGFVHCAGIEYTKPLVSMKPENYQEVFEVNVISGFYLAKILSKKKNFKEEGGSMVFMSSVMGILGQKGKIAYCSSKAAVIGGAKSLALELASKNIRVNSVSPAMVKTELAEKMFETLPKESVDEIVKKHPLGIGQPDDVANLCIFLLSDLSKWITGTNIIIDGGYSAE